MYAGIFGFCHKRGRRVIILDAAYKQIWRPSQNSGCCAAKNFSDSFIELCDGYARVENKLRKLLTRIPPQNRSQPVRAVYAPLRQAAFELQENFLQVLLANGVSRRNLPGGGKITPALFALLEPAMRLSEYRVYADFDTGGANKNANNRATSGMNKSISDGETDGTGKVINNCANNSTDKDISDGTNKPASHRADGAAITDENKNANINVNRDAGSSANNGAAEFLRPFETFYEQGAPWYLADAHPLWRNSAHLPRCTPENLIMAVGALKCLLYAQFGREVDGMITSFSAKGDGAGYYRRESLFKVEPPEWKPEECYGFAYAPGELLPVRKYPFDTAPVGK